MRWYDRLQQVCLCERGMEEWSVSSIVACQIALTQVCWQTNCLTCSCCCRSEDADLQCLRTEWVWPGQSCVSGVQSTECEQTGSRDRSPHSCSRWPSAIHKQGDEENHTQFLQCILNWSSSLTNLKLCRITEVHVSLENLLSHFPPWTHFFSFFFSKKATYIQIHNSVLFDWQYFTEYSMEHCESHITLLCNLSSKGQNITWSSTLKSGSSLQAKRLFIHGCFLWKLGFQGTNLQEVGSSFVEMNAKNWAESNCILFIPLHGFDILSSTRHFEVN